ncbi:hypothetical protein IC229_32865 [Spirosoma sp. BT702]|uniref:Uncharacterized protein n=1 Tax=Spirosoma profusum TaxID=2771354 RepID=A0A927AW17_9BACT|nr:hypothetical protein [Spirosoma profusum]MBD2705449.1 hypothetical protein [Spirosoma profusum]
MAAETAHLSHGSRTLKLQLFPFHPTPTGVDGERVSSFHYGTPTFTPLFGWAARLPLGRASCHPAATLREANH